MSSNDLTRQSDSFSCLPENYLVDLPISPFKTMPELDNISSSDQLSAIEQFVTIAERVEDEIQEKRRLLGRAIEMLEEQEAALRATIHAHQTLLLQGRSPLGRLSLEILGRIFIYARDESYINFKPTQSLLSTPMSVYQVCQRWRKAALMRPDLWSRICLTASLPWSEGENFNPLIEQLSLCLERSCDRSLAIRIDSDEGDDSTDEEDKLSDEECNSEDSGSYQHERKPHWGDNLPLSLLKAHSGRVSDLEIALHPMSCAWPPIEDFKVSFSSLVSLRIFHLGDLSGFRGHFRSLFVTTSLTKLTLRVNKLDMGIITTLPVKKLTRIEVEGATLSSWTKLLERTVNLRELHWTYNENLGRSKKPKDEFSLQDLRRLAAPTVPGAQFEFSLARMRFPKLESLSLNMEVFSTCRDFEFITSDSLRTLSLVFNAYVGPKRRIRFPKHVKKLLSRLPKLAPKLKNFSLAFDPGKEMETCPVKDHLHAGFVMLIESMRNRDEHHFKGLETLALGDMSFSVMHEPLLHLIQEGSLEGLKEITLAFLGPVQPHLLSDWRDEMNFACSLKGVRVTINT